jgi:hypothetical protein
MDINKPWRNGLTRSLYHMLRPLDIQSAERNDAIACDGDICQTRRLPRAINYLATPDQHVTPFYCLTHCSSSLLTQLVIE